MHFYEGDKACGLTQVKLPDKAIHKKVWSYKHVLNNACKSPLYNMV